MTYLRRPGTGIRMLVKRALAHADIAVETRCGALARRPEQHLRIDPVYVLARLSLEGELNVLQIGAFDGVRNDFLADLIRRDSVRATLLEPEPDAFQRLHQLLDGNPKIQLCNAAVADRTGTIDFYRVRPEFRQIDPNCHQYSGLTPQVIRSHMRHLVPDVEQLIERIEVPAWRYADLLDDLELDPNVVLIDTEGFDGAIVRQLLAASRQPDVIVFEIRHLPRAELWQTFEALFDADYRVLECSPDAVAVKGPLAQRWNSQL